MAKSSMIMTKLSLKALLVFFVAVSIQKGLADNEGVFEVDSEVANDVKDITKDLTDEIKEKEEQMYQFINETSFLDGLNLTSSQEQIDTYTNETKSNETNPAEDASKEKARWSCNLMSLFSPPEEQKVILVKNDTQVSDVVAKSNDSQSCFLLYFYVGWCEFCADIAAEINTLGRAYFGLPVFAVDSYQLSSIAGKFGVTGVPTLILFYNGRPVAKFNRTRSLQGLEDFITETTGFSSNVSMLVDDQDFDGPIPTKIDEQGDIYLTLSFISVFVIAAINWCLTEQAKSIFKRLSERFKSWALHEKTE